MVLRIGRGIDRGELGPGKGVWVENLRGTRASPLIVICLKRRKGLCWTWWLTMKEPRDQVPAEGSAPCSYSGYTVVTGHQEMQPQQVLAAKLSESWL